MSSCHPLGGAIAATHAANTITRQAAIAAETRTRCPWCDVYVRSSAGLCICTEACGCITCPARNADDYTPPPVPIFAIPAPRPETPDA